MNKNLVFKTLAEPFALAAGDQQYGAMMKALIDFFNNFLIPTLLTIASGVFLVLIIINGIRMARASTDEEKTKAKKALIGQAIGMVVCFVGVWLVPAFVEFLQAVFVPDGLDQITAGQ